MRIKQMARMIQDTFASVMGLTETKGREYAEANGDESDRLSNFKKGGTDNNMHPYQYWSVLAGKHWTSIRDYVNRTARGEQPVGSEDIFGRIDDLILYAVLLKCLIADHDRRIFTGRDVAPSEPVFNAILEERRFQDKKYGPPHGSGGHELAAWLLVVEAELNEAKLAAMHGGYQSGLGRDSVRSEIVQIAAVCVAALEQHGVKELDDAKTSYGAATACGVDGASYTRDGAEERLDEKFILTGNADADRSILGRRIAARERNAYLDDARKEPGVPRNDYVSRERAQRTHERAQRASDVDRSAKSDVTAAGTGPQRFVPE